MTDAQQWLDTNFHPGNSIERSQVVNLTITRSRVSGTIRWIFSWLVGNSRTEITLASQLTGNLNLNGFTSLQTLDLQNNQLTSLTVTGANNLRVLNCSSNELTSLNVSGLIQLRELRCGNNKLTSLNVSGNISLTNLTCLNNPNLERIIGLQDLRNLITIDCNNTRLRPINQLRNQINSDFLTGISRNSAVMSAIDNQITNSAPNGHVAITTAITTATAANNGNNLITRALNLADILTALQGDATITGVAEAGGTEAVRTILTATISHHTVISAYTNLGVTHAAAGSVLAALDAAYVANTAGVAIAVGGAWQGLINGVANFNGGDNNFRKATTLADMEVAFRASTGATGGDVASAITAGGDLTVPTSFSSSIRNAFAHHTVNSAYNNLGYNGLLNREIIACRDVRDTDLPENVITPTQKAQAGAEIVAYEAKILQINPWQN